MVRLRYALAISGASSSVGIENTRRPVISCPPRVIPLSRSIFVGATTCHQTKGRSLGKVQWLALRIHASTSYNNGIGYDEPAHARKKGGKREGKKRPFLLCIGAEAVAGCAGHAGHARY